MELLHVIVGNGFFFCASILPGELFGALKGRLYDSNKNLIMATLSTIGGVASSMGAAVEKSSKVQLLTVLVPQAPPISFNCNYMRTWWFFLQGILSDVLKCLGDNKKHMREYTLSTLDSWLAAVHLDKMVTSLLLFL